MTNEKQPNYDPADPDKMRLPAGITCGDCAHIRRCKMIFGHAETDTYCDCRRRGFVRNQRKANHDQMETCSG